MNSDGMKLIIIVVNDSESDSMLKTLIDEGFRITRIASTGGFLRRGSSTFLIGVEAEKVARVVQLVRDYCVPSIDLGFKKVTVFVLNVDQFEQF
jgi:uncharacterized protein YaaQ